MFYFFFHDNDWSNRFQSFCMQTPGRKRKKFSPAVEGETRSERNKEKTYSEVSDEEDQIDVTDDSNTGQNDTYD
jgi:hypothetical protein